MKTLTTNGSTPLIIDRFFWKDIESEFGIGETARANRIKAAVEIGAMPPPKKEGRASYLDQEQMAELRFQHSHLATGGTLKSYQELRTTKTANLVEVRPGELTEDSVGGIDKYWGENPVDSELDTIRRNAIDAFNMNPRIQAYAQLEVFLRKGCPISDSEIINLFGWKPPRTGFVEYCYQFIFYAYVYVADKDGNPIKEKAWRIKKLDLEKINQERGEKRIAVNAARKLQRRQEDIEHQKRAGKNYQAVRDLMNDE